jgi:hypothetical protein
MTIEQRLIAIFILPVLLDRAGNGLPSTIVEVYAVVDGQLGIIGKTVSGEADRRTRKPQGYYRVSVPSGKLIAAVSYNNDAWQPRLVKDVSGQTGDDHVINKVLLDRQGPVSFLPILEQVHQYQELYYLERELAGTFASAEDVRRSMRAKYQDRILSMPDPRRTNQQSPKQKEIVSRMTDEQRQVLSQKMDELFHLCGIPLHSYLQRSRWMTTYVSPGGDPVRAMVLLNGRSGTYQILGAARTLLDRGELSDIEIQPEGDRFLVTGKWKLGERKGYFRWATGPGVPASFEGEWGYKADRGPQGPWSGELIVER